MVKKLIDEAQKRGERFMTRARDMKSKVSNQIKKSSHKAGSTAKKAMRFQQKTLSKAGKDIHNTFTHHKVFVVIIAVLTLGLLLDFFSGGFTSQLLKNDPATTVDFLGKFGAFSAVIYILIISLEVIIAPIPSIVFYAAGGLAFGTVKGSILILIGNMIGAVICYFLSRYFFKEYFEKKIPPALLQKFNASTNKYGPYALFFLRLNPFTSSDIFSYVAGVTNIRFVPFLISTSLGIAPLIFAQTYLGADVIGKSKILSLLFILFSLLYVAAFVYILIKSSDWLKKRKK
ncbi:MAG TPA: TVP38/TMEM64 family protein [Acidobacteriota bacterium]|nr:TVP38/TMEM64 family protein [Acidobacteriota bacterium]